MEAATRPNFSASHSGEAFGFDGEAGGSVAGSVSGVGGEERERIWTGRKQEAEHTDTFEKQC